MHAEVLGVSKDLSKRRDEAARLAKEGHYEEARTAYRNILQVDQNDPTSLLKCGELARRLGSVQEAVRCYATAAQILANEGALLKAIAACKLILKVEPAHTATQHVLAALYAKKSREDMLDQARRENSEGVEELDVVDAQPLALPTILLFSDLPRNAFIQLIRRLNMRAVLPGESIIREGEVGDAMYIVSNGRVKVTKMSEAGTEIVLASLTDGAFFGEMALLSEAPRAASVVAEEETLLFELSRPMLAEITEIFPAVSQTMLRFYRQRLLTNLMATSPLFKPLNAEERRTLVEKFKSREVPAHEKILVEGAPGDGLYMLLTGAAEVSKKTPMGPKVVAHLKEGDLFGEMSLLQNRPVSATVESLKKCIVLKLSRQTFMEVASTHPHVLEQIAEISAEREKINDAILSGRLAFSSEGLIVL